MSKYRINKRFQSHVERTPRVIECAEAFGLGLNDKEFVLFDDLEVELRQGEVAYITGQSGSGKSVLLRILSEQMAEQGKRIVRIEDVQVEDKPLIEQVGRTTNDAIRLLSKAGLNDAYLFIRKPSQLSDGQMYRLRIAKLMEADDADVWVADEFGAVLDRVTARVVATQAQKMARAKGVTLIVATTHNDLREELGPNLYVSKRYQDQVKVEETHDA